MKTAIYIEDGIVQLVLTPESEFEKSAIASFNQGNLDAQVFRGAFYDCRGGWTRQSSYYPGVSSNTKEDHSLILRVATSQEPK